MISYEYDMADGKFVIACRSALVRYTLFALNVFLEYEDTPVGRQHLVVLNREEVFKHLV